MSGNEKNFSEGLKRLGISGNLLEAIMESYKECFPVMEGFMVRSPSERYASGNKVTPEKVDEIVNGLDDYEREVYNDMTVLEKKLFIADMINKANGLGTVDLSGKNVIDEKALKAYMRKVDRIHRHKEKVAKDLDREERLELRKKRQEHKNSELTDPNFGGVPIEYRTHLYMCGKQDYTDSYRGEHPGEKGKFRDLMLFVTNAVENPENYEWWDQLSEKQQETARKEASRKRVVFAMRTNVAPPNGTSVSPDEIKKKFSELMSGKAPVSEGASIDRDSAFRGFGNGESGSGKAEANRIFLHDIPRSMLIENEYVEIDNLSDLDGYVLASGDRVRTELWLTDKELKDRRISKVINSVANSIFRKYSIDLNKVLNLVTGVVYGSVDPFEYSRIIAEIISNKYNIDSDKVLTWCKDVFEGKTDTCENKDVLKEIVYLVEKYRILEKEQEKV